MGKNKAKNTVRFGRKWYRKEYLKSETWKRIRLGALKRANHTCEKCGSKATDIHHMDYSCIGKYVHDLSWFLIALCRPCHELVERAKELHVIPFTHQRKHIIKLSKADVNKALKRRFEKVLIDGKIINGINTIPFWKRRLIYGVLKYTFVDPMDLLAKEITRSQESKIWKIINSCKNS